MRVTIENISAWVLIEGVEQHQHAIEYSPERKVATCWIASEAGKANGIVPIERKHGTAPAPGDTVMDLTLEDDEEGDTAEAERIKALKEELAVLERKQQKCQKRVKLEPKIEVKEEPGQLRQGGLRQLDVVIDLTLWCVCFDHRAWILLIGTWP
ncbi:hypothetical protein H0H81_003310 [Sphagnurus paluster]|uniref:Uncharacterized protein n=1 Tax=Sphagnurus paluster TaxID=117069 RepID=A0A9P7GFE2_9AGAR|nr:hypothetical protein H0H81_003310 [Sphagnurus paluster]